MPNTHIEKIKEEWNRAKYGMDMLDDKIVDWWLSKFSLLLSEIIDELESNPNENSSASPNIQHFIEKKQSQLSKKYNVK